MWWASDTCRACRGTRRVFVVQADCSAVKVPCPDCDRTGYRPGSATYMAIARERGERVELIYDA